ncbi:Formyl-CoA:oxalate CoA-transferase [compost metagenome]
MQDIASDPHLQARGAVTTVQAPGIPARLAVGAPARFGATDQVGIRRLTPALGQDEDYVFGELLGMDSAQRADLEARGVIL